MGNCICIDSGDSAPEFVNVAWPKARKRHLCGECYRDIEPGEEYERVEGVWEGEFYTFKTCSECCEIRDVLFNCGYNYEAVWEHVLEYIEDVSLPDFHKLSWPARDKLMAKLDERDKWRDED